MAVISMKQLLEAGVHFGHQTRRWNPKMKNISSLREMVFISSTYKNSEKVDEAYNFETSFRRWWTSLIRRN